MYRIKSKITGEYFCGWHEFVKLDAMGNERWNDVFPYFNTFPIEEYATREEAEKQVGYFLDPENYEIEEL